MDRLRLILIDDNRERHYAFERFVAPRLLARGVDCDYSCGRSLDAIEQPLPRRSYEVGPDLFDAVALTKREKGHNLIVTDLRLDEFGSGGESSQAAFSVLSHLRVTYEDQLEAAFPAVIIYSNLAASYRQVLDKYRRDYDFTFVEMPLDISESAWDSLYNEISSVLWKPRIAIRPDRHRSSVDVEGQRYYEFISPVIESPDGHTRPRFHEWSYRSIVFQVLAHHACTPLSHREIEDICAKIQVRLDPNIKRRRPFSAEDARMILSDFCRSVLKGAVRHVSRGAYTLNAEIDWSFKI